jgi:hypothetical protein
MKKISVKLIAPKGQVITIKSRKAPSLRLEFEIENMFLAGEVFAYTIRIGYADGSEELFRVWPEECHCVEESEKKSADDVLNAAV